jgi:hypothetical protein
MHVTLSPCSCVAVFEPRADKRFPQLSHDQSLSLTNLVGENVKVIFLYYYTRNDRLIQNALKFIIYRPRYLYSGIETRDYELRGSAALTTRHPSIRKSWH